MKDLRATEQIYSKIRTFPSCAAAGAREVQPHTSPAPVPASGCICFVVFNHDDTFIIFFLRACSSMGWARVCVIMDVCFRQASMIWVPAACSRAYSRGMMMIATWEGEVSGHGWWCVLFKWELYFLMNRFYHNFIGDVDNRNDNRNMPTTTTTTTMMLI